MPARTWKMARWVVIALLFEGCIQSPFIQDAGQMPLTGENMKKVSFTTTDNTLISANIFEPLKPNGKTVIMIPMLGHTKIAYAALAQGLSAKGYRALALDVRGHGESTQQNGKTISYQSFSSSQWNHAVNDIQAAQDFLKEEKVFLVGASIGANLGAVYTGKNPERVQGLVLLSPGLDYKGVQPKPALESFEGPVLIMASKEDAYSFDSSMELEEAVAGAHTFIQLNNVGHGTNMFLKNPDLMNTIVDWLDKN